MPLRSWSESAQSNADAQWDDFDPTLYVQKNYSTVLSVDETIISIVRAHFSDHFRRVSGPAVRGIDVGAGANLYPALSMLPWCDEITLLDRSKTNLDYLRHQLAGHDDVWEKFWRKLCLENAYAVLPGGPWARLSDVAKVELGDILEPVDDPGRWQTGTMFFVAESMSTSTEEFHRAVRHFLEMLAPGAPFAAAFMEHSQGYSVGSTWFPACDVGEDDIRASIGRSAESVRTYRIGRPGEVRPGYTSIVLACGFR
ncbi:SCO2525 family SAM-dependent methyltransferase [Streptomyces rochei]|uniref:SCO2525 family SAM-dependent methyltransferase n=1 Tax=Streptomyces vinaceusdrappus TaxID=67376 RepID=A0ABY6BT34_9ACTN|nr:MULTISPECIES: SCO2525 family SAM-dependent methyltransferase [Streptomyces]RIH61968.1 methyltransferase [Streptomyces sp. SHP22-7]KYK10063.1 methyltransferase [Streptomyces sp. CC71]MBJ6619526.1 methyltransferase [Streptomyces sp. DHE17-7]PVD10530.1 methyltransferase [Streptomyces sp. CS207]RSS12963.1 methyltransferase [Streptomyces sp. WAC08401]